MTQNIHDSNLKGRRKILQFQVGFPPHPPLARFFYESYVGHFEDNFALGNEKVAPLEYTHFSISHQFS